MNGEEEGRKPRSKRQKQREDIGYIHMKRKRKMPKSQIKRTAAIDLHATAYLAVAIRKLRTEQGVNE